MANYALQYNEYDSNGISVNLTQRPNIMQNQYIEVPVYTPTAYTVNESDIIAEDGSVLVPSIRGFLNKMQNFFFRPPSDNLWTINIDSESSPENTNPNQPYRSLASLYDAIIATNNNWSSMVNTGWKIKLNETYTKCKNYIEHFENEHGIFLAQDVSFSPIQTLVNTNFFTGGQQHGSFYNFGNISQSRPNNRNLNISFLVSNWDIGDVLFDPWIAAVAQKGLVEDGNSTIKARITVSEYTSGYPYQEYSKLGGNKIPPSRMVLRKQYIFRNCIPVKRGEVSKNYNSDESGTFKKSIVNFHFDDYQIIYQF